MTDYADLKAKAEAAKGHIHSQACLEDDCVMDLHEAASSPDVVLALCAENERYEQALYWLETYHPQEYEAAMAWRWPALQEGRPA